MAQSIKKAVFPVAGMGTRFLPATKANPKEMLPIVDRPLIQYAVDEAVKAGITELIFVTSMGKRAIEDHFDMNYELEAKLEAKQKYELLEEVKAILPEGVNCAYIRQPSALGLGHAVWCARAMVQNEPFAVLLADELMDQDKTNPLSDMISLYHAHEQSVLACVKVEPDEVHRYGIVGLEDQGDRRPTINGIVEKPQRFEAPSQFAAVGRYVLTPEIFDYLTKTPPGAGGEIQLTDALAGLLKEQGLYPYFFTEKRHDCGSKIGYLKATVEHGLKHPELGADFKRYLKALYEHELKEANEPSAIASTTES